MKENVSVVWYFMAFPLGKFRKMWQIGGIYFSSVGDLQDLFFFFCICSTRPVLFCKIPINSYNKPYFFRVKHSYPAGLRMLWKFWKISLNEWMNEWMNEGKFKKITNKVMKGKKHICLGHLQFKTKTQNFNKGDSKTLFNRCLLHV